MTASRQAVPSARLRRRRAKAPSVERLLAPGYRQVVAARCPGIELARAPDLLIGVLDHLFPLGDPADGAGEREQHREHGGREAHGLEGDARIEVDVWIKLLLDEIFVAQGDAL